MCRGARFAPETSYTTFNIAFEFNPIEALESTDKKTLKGEVAKKYWDTLEIGQSVTASYSRDNPEIVILDGE